MGAVGGTVYAAKVRIFFLKRAEGLAPKLLAASAAS